MIILAQGPEITKVTKEEALNEIRAVAHLDSDTDVTMENYDGKWYAAWNQKEANFPDAANDADDESPGPKSEGPDDAAPSPDGESDSDDDSDDDPDGDGIPSSEDDNKKKEHDPDKHLLTEIHDSLKKLLMALGIPDGNATPSPNPAAPSPDANPTALPGEENPVQEIRHERALKPGETPPGQTPVGAPAFSSVVPDNHPWKAYEKTAASFVVKEPLNEGETLASFDSELARVAHNTPFKVKQSTVIQENGKPFAVAQISRY